MSPHRLAWGFAYSFPFGVIVAGATLTALIVSKEPKRIPVTPITVTLTIFIMWMSVTTAFALTPEKAVVEWERVLKIQLMVFVTLMLFRSRERLTALVWVVVVSIGFYGIKGGVFTILTGGTHRVWGPPGTFIENNNQLALALVMVLPLMRYLYVQSTNRWLRYGLLGASGLSVLSVMSTYSRGGFLALAVVGVFFWWRSRRKLVSAMVIALAVGAGLLFMPDRWTDRIESIQQYEQDASAQGRINAWTFALNVANDRPLVGGGYRVFNREWFRVYAPEQENYHDAHSIYFEVLGEHGYVGLILFVAIGCLTYFKRADIKRQVRRMPQMSWALDLATMCQLSILGYAVGGAFSGLAYYDLYYHLVGIMVLLGVLVREKATKESAADIANMRWDQKSGAPEAR